MEGLSVDYGKVYTTIIMGIIHMYCAYIHCSHCIRVGSVEPVFDGDLWVHHT